MIEKDLQRGTPEWQKIEMNFKLTMPAAQISKITRIQNMKLWKVFKNELEEI